MKSLFFSLDKLIVFLLTSSIGFYLAKLTPFSPIYIIYLLAILLFFIYSMQIKKFYFPDDSKLLFFLFVYMILTQSLYAMHGEFINLFISIFGYIIMRSLNHNLDIRLNLIFFSNMLKITIVILILDTAYRLSHPGAPNDEMMNALSSSEDLFFYIYKFNSIMFADSNSTGLVALILFFSTISIKRYVNNDFINYKKENVLLVLIILSSLSRAAYSAFFVGLLYVYLLSAKRKWKIIVLFLVITLIIEIISLLFNYLSSDPSFLSKFDIIHNTLQKFGSLTYLQQFTGVGFGQAEKVIGAYTHLILLTYLLEMGLLGLIIFLLFVIFYSLKYSTIVWIPVMTAGLSFFVYVGTPFLFVPLAIIANIIDLQRRRIIYENSLLFTIASAKGSNNCC